MQAEDKDTERSVTYRLVQGDLDKFAIDPATGVVRTIRGLDYEFRQSYRLVVGTEEARLAGQATGDRDREGNALTTVVEIVVEDRNDVPPVFTKTPRSNYVEVNNDAPVGTVVGKPRADFFKKHFNIAEYFHMILFVPMNS